MAASFLPEYLTGLSLILVIPAVVSLLLTMESLRSRHDGRGRYFAFAMLGLSWWCLTYSLELSAPSREAMTFWLKLQYLTIPFISLFIYFFVREQVGAQPLKRPLIYTFWLIPAATLLLQVTHDHHNFFYRSVILLDDGTHHPRFELTPGIWYFVHSLYNYFLAGLTGYLLIQRIQYEQVREKKRPLQVLLIALLLPFLAFTIYFLGWMPLAGLDPTPFAFTGSGILMAIAVFRLGLLNLRPVAHETVFRCVGLPCVIFDDKAQVIDANPAALTLWDWRFIPMGVEIDKIPLLPVEIKRAVREYHRADSTVQIKVRDQSRDFLIQVFPVNDSERRSPNTLVLVREETERRQFELQLSESNRRRERLLKILSHDLRSNFAGLLGLARLLHDEEDPRLSEEGQQIARTLEASILSSTELLENILSWTSLQDQAVEHRPNSRILPLAEEVVATAKAQATAKVIRIDLKIPAELSFPLEPPLFSMLLRNLLSNAIKFTHRGGSVRISIETSADKQTLITTVEDSGIGIPADLLEHLWEPGARTGRRGTDNEVTSGLGLAFCHEAVTRHGGRIEVESREGWGTTFRVYLPSRG